MGFNRQNAHTGENGLILTIKLGEFIEIVNEAGQICKVWFLNHGGGAGKFQVVGDRKAFRVGRTTSLTKDVKP